MSVAFVLGNGTSRKDIPLEPLRQYGKIYGCNAIYRTFDCDYLVAVDAKMVMEIAQSNYQMRIPVWTNPNKTFKDVKGLNFFNPSKGWSSGPTALDLATYHQHKTFYLLGFDFKGTTGTGGNEDKVNNIYAGTLNYKNENDNATYYGNWERQTGIIAQRNHLNRYIRVVKDGEDFCPKSLKKFSNFTHMTVTEFCKQFAESH